MWPFGGSKVVQSEGSIAVEPSAGPPSGINLQDEASAEDKCPVDHETRSAWLAQHRHQHPSTGGDQDQKQSNATSAFAFLSAGSGSSSPPSSTGMGNKSGGGSEANMKAKASGQPNLSTDRVTSSIPRFGAAAKKVEEEVQSLTAKAAAAAATTSEPIDPGKSSNWVYPSPSQFFAAMERKNHNPQAEDMNVVVPIHNAVNERAWQQILGWERMADGGDSWKTCGGPQLVSFRGRPKELTWRAWAFGLVGYQKPFDRHDWEVDRCGRRIKYVIDFYTGRTGNGPAGFSFYLDVRPSPADPEGVRMRLKRLFTRPAPSPQL